VYDRATQQYFDAFTPNFLPERFHFALDFLRANATEESALIDIGCGDGATLWMIKNQANMRNLTGLDISENYLRKAAQSVGCQTIHGSILNDAVVARHAGSFDFCVLGAVLHHLIGSSRRKSRAAAAKCLRNAVTLLKPGGYVLIFEPTHGPAPLMTAVFYLKKLVGGLFPRRIELFRTWANFGQPVVSYYTAAQLDRMVADLPSARVVERRLVDSSRMGLVIQRQGVGLIVQSAPGRALAALNAAA
jgi:SAM-dependent methyltransferase